MQVAVFLSTPYAWAGWSPLLLSALLLLYFRILFWRSSYPINRPIISRFSFVWIQLPLVLHLLPALLFPHLFIIVPLIRFFSWNPLLLFFCSLIFRFLRFFFLRPALLYAVLDLSPKCLCLSWETNEYFTESQISGHVGCPVHSLKKKHGFEAKTTTMPRVQ